jgi:hypothetical protein
MGRPKRHIQPERYVQYFMPTFIVAGAIHGACNLYFMDF